jgi:hypothetical protein
MQGASWKTRTSCAQSISMAVPLAPLQRARNCCQSSTGRHQCRRHTQRQIPDLATMMPPKCSTPEVRRVYGWGCMGGWMQGVYMPLDMGGADGTK